MHFANPSLGVVHVSYRIWHRRWKNDLICVKRNAGELAFSGVKIPVAKDEAAQDEAPIG